MARNKYDMDEILEDSFDMKQLKRLAGYITPYKGKMLFVIVLLLSSSALTMLIPIFFQRIMDYYIPAKDIGKIILMCVFTTLIALYTAITWRYKIQTMSIIGQSIIHSIRTDIFCRSFLFPTMTTDLTVKFRSAW